MYIAGEWCGSSERIEVLHPYDQRVIDTVPAATAAELERCIAIASEGAKIAAAMSAHERVEMLRRAADLLAERQEEFGQLISMESGKVLTEGRFEAARAAETLRLSSEEAGRLAGEVLQLDAASGSSGQLGFTLRVPCGVVAAITPFNFPLNLVCHKVGPALAAGNSVILKPASATPLSALKLTELLLEAGVPASCLACITGSGSLIGGGLARDPRIRKISFTGSVPVGEAICRDAGIKRVTMELGSNAPILILEDADLDLAVKATIATGYSNAGQVCISAQRVIVAEALYEEVLDRLARDVGSLSAGDPMRGDTRVGPLINEGEASRVRSWLTDAVEHGGRLLVGGEQEGGVLSPAVLADLKDDALMSQQELFGPAVGVRSCASFDEAIRLANDTAFGLSAAIFTRDIDQALRFAREVESGSLHINWGPAWRADLMPYGGLKQSGLGKEGPKYAIEEMTETKAVVFHPSA